MAHFSLIPHTICYYIYPFYFDMKEIKKNVGHFAANGAGSHRKSGDPTNRKLHLPSRGRQRFIAAIWITAGSIAALVFIIFFAISQGWIGYVPAVEQLENPIDRYATQLISADGKSLGSFSYSQDNRFYASYQDLSPDLVQALIATEDVRFTDHSGIDVRGLFRAIVKRGLMGQRSGGGGSTITQQLAKQLYSPSVESLTERLLQKPIEWVIAVRLERYYTKEEIINMYLNKFDFLHNAVGIRSAAQSYFGKTPATLTTEECRVLLSLLAVSILMSAVYLWQKDFYATFGDSLRFVSFNFVSIGLASGFSNADFAQWPLIVSLWMFFLSNLLASSGSMGGGIKNVRALVLFKFSLREMMILLHPRAVRTVKVNGRMIPDRMALTVMAFISIYFMTTIVFSFLLMASGMEFISAFTAVIACITNAGPGLGEVGPAGSYAVLSDVQKWLCSAVMLLGRLEIFTVLILLTPAYWKK